MMRNLRRCSVGALVVLVLVAMASAVQAQVTTRILSGGNAGLNQFGAFGPSGPGISRSELPRLDIAKLRAQDEQYRKNGRPLRVAVQQNISLDITKAGTVTERNGYRIYQHEILAPEAGGLSAKFDRLQLAEGARVFLYNAAQTVLIGPITSQQNITYATFTSGHVTGDRLIIELQEPIGVAGQSQLHLLGVANFYEPRGPFGPLRPAQSCENNQACFPDYQAEADGVALVLVDDGAGSAYICTGSTVNDARQSFRSFFLTAFHCTDFNGNQVNEPNEANSTAGWTFYFKYQSATCTPNTDDNVYVTINGATYRSGSAASDFTLVELNAQAPQSESISFLGWDRSSSLSSTVFGIHHPNGSLKKISFGGATSTVGVTYFPGGSYNTGPGTSFLQLSWNNGVTEGGSSGSALFDGTSRRVVGQLLGGSSFCSSPNAPDQYGRFFTSWTGGGANTNRLSNWLDPTGISGNTTNLAVPTVSGPAAFTNTSSFSLNTGISSITSWSIISANAVAFSASSGSGNVANLTATADASNAVIRFTVDAGQSYPIQFTKTFNATAAAPPANTAPVATSNANQTATVGVAFSYTVNAFTDAETPNDLTYTASINPPNGLSFNAATRVISGTPSMSGVSSVTVTATDPGSLSASTSFTITVNPAPIVVTPLALTLTANPTMLTTSGTTTLSATVSGGTTPYSYTFAGPGTITPSGNTATASGLPAGVQTFTVVAKDATSPTSQTISGTVSVTVSMDPPANMAPVATANANQTATVGQAFSYTVNAFTDPESQMLTYTASIDPTNGFSFDANTRVISGTPSMSGVSSVTVTATDPGSLSASTSFTITVNPAGTPPPTATFSITGVTTVSCETLSAGQRRVTFNPRYAGLDGTPVSFSVVNEMLPTTAPGPYALNLFTDNPVITLNAAQSGANTLFAYNWLSACSSSTGNTPPTVANPVPPQSATVGIAYTLSLANVFTDAETPNGLTLSVSGLPTGLNFVAPSTISGTPSMSGVSTVTVTATDPGSLSASTSFSITVNPAAGTPPPPSGTFSITSVQTISCEVLSAGQRRLTFNPQYAGTNGAPISFSVVSEMLPTTAPGPYTLNLFTDNPVVTLQAVQSGISSSFAYNWLAVCSSTTANTPPTVANPVPPQSATVGVAYTLSLANVFTDAETPNQLTLAVSGLPAGLNFVAPSTISGTPSMSGVSTVTVTATDPGSLSASTSFSITVNPAGGTPPPTGTFSITGVTTVNCQVISAGQRQVSFTPRYAGLDGSPVSFSVANEMLPTTNPGPYTLNLYTDNPTITLSAVQSGVSSTFAYNWLAACTPAAPSARVGAGSELTGKLKATILPNPVSDEFRVRIEGLQGQAVRLELSDVSGHSMVNRLVKVVSDDHQESVRFPQPGRGLYLLRVSTGQQAVTLKVIRE